MKVFFLQDEGRQNVPHVTPNGGAVEGTTKVKVKKKVS